MRLGIWSLTYLYNPNSWRWSGITICESFNITITRSNFLYKVLFFSHFLGVLLYTFQQKKRIYDVLQHKEKILEMSMHLQGSDFWTCKLMSIFSFRIFEDFISIMEGKQHKVSAKLCEGIISRSKFHVSYVAHLI